MGKYWIARTPTIWTVREQVTDRYVCEYPAFEWGALANKIAMCNNDADVWQLIHDYHHEGD